MVQIGQPPILLCCLFFSAFTTLRLGFATSCSEASPGLVRCWWAGGSHETCPQLLFPLLFALQVTRIQYLNALLATRAQNLPQLPENAELQIIPSSQALLCNDKAAATIATGEPKWHCLWYVSRGCMCLC